MGIPVGIIELGRPSEHISLGQEEQDWIKGKLQEMGGRFGITPDQAIGLFNLQGQDKRESFRRIWRFFQNGGSDLGFHVEFKSGLVVIAQGAAPVGHHIGDVQGIDKFMAMPLIAGQTEAIVLRVCVGLGVQAPSIGFSGRSTVQRKGYYNQLEMRITINSSGENVGTLLHELAHHVVRVKCGKYVQAHGIEFKRALRDIIKFMEVVQ